MADYKELVNELRTFVYVPAALQAADAIEELLLENDALGRSLCECDDLLKKLERENRRNTEEVHNER